MTADENGSNLWQRELTQPDIPVLAHAGVQEALRLVLVGPTGVVRTHWLRSSARIGRSNECEILVPDTSVSRVHAIAERVSEHGWRLVDAESRNGVWHEGYSVQSCNLCEGVILRIGRHFLVTERGPLSVTTTDESLAGAAFTKSVARIDSLQIPLLLLGPTGAGKSWLAEHLCARLSPGRPFVALNCAELSPSLVEAELFGAEKGAYTGLSHARIGLIEQANGGVLFLDEVGTLTPALQAKLLHVLESGKVRPVGSTRWRPVNWQLIAATNHDLRQGVADGTFREDLYHRLAGRVVTVPSLASRRPDIPALCDTLFGSPVWQHLTPDEHDYLLNHPWPGNIRELRHLMAHDTLAALHAELGHRLVIRSQARRGRRSQGSPSPLVSNDTLTPNPADTPAPHFDTEPLDFLRDTGPVDTVPHSSTPIPDGPVTPGSGIHLPRRRSRPGPKVDRPSRDELLQLLEKNGDNIAAVARELGKGPTQIRRWLGLA